MSHREVEYRGHTITVESHPFGNGFQWSYQINGSHYTRSRERPIMNQELMLYEAVREAKAHVDLLLHKT